MNVTLIISTYNWPAALEVCLKSILKQNRLPDEVIIADDGSGIETQELVQRYKKKFPVPLKHVWHPDQGFQLAAIRNKAILVAASPYIIQIDGDLLLHRDFIADHIALASKGKFVSGSRLLLPEAFSTEILERRNLPSSIELLLKGSNRLNATRIPFLTRVLAPVYKKNKPFYVKGCNMAFWRDDLIAVNGYNEAITGWGKEDSELAVRLINYGVGRLFIKFGGICYHLYHTVASREKEDFNDVILQKTIDEKRISIPSGLNSHKKEDITIL